MTMTMTTRTTFTTTRRGKLATASSLLLLCVALLMSKSCGILALSGDGNEELLSQPDAWSQLGEGSGWDAEIGIKEPTDEIIIEPVELDTASDQADIPADNELATSEPSDAATTPGSNESEPATNDDQPITSPNEEQPTTVPSEEEPTTSSNEENTTAEPNEDNNPTTIPNEEQPETTEADAPVSTIAPTPPPQTPFECTAAGLYPQINGDCEHFYNCLLDAFTGELLAFEMLCPPMTVFSPTYGRCVRDLATCQSDEFVCPSAGHFAGSTDTYYYNCIPNLQGGYHKYIVRCSPYQRFEPMVGRCWRYDWTQVYPGQSLESIDLQAIKIEQKQFKAEDKLRQKAEKAKEKEARKKQKQEEKLAKKAAKEQAKKDAKGNKSLFSIESVESIELLTY